MKTPEILERQELENTAYEPLGRWGEEPMRQRWREKRKTGQENP